MELIFLIIFIAIIFIVLIFAITTKVKLVFDSDKSDINMTLLWIFPLVKAFITIEETKPVLSFYLFNKLIFKKILRRGKENHNALELVQLTNPSHVQVDVEYGFSDPFNTGVACGVLNIASQFINIDTLNQSPDFMSSNGYIYLNANAKVNLGTTIINLYKTRKSI